MSKEDENDCHRWARLRFSIIGGLLACPPSPGQLQQQLHLLAQKQWQHPTKDEWLSFSPSTIERWYYKAKDTLDPIDALSRQIRSDAGQTKELHPQLLAHLEQQYRAHCGWTYQLHYDNLAEMARQHPQWGPLPTYATIRRRMQKMGWYKKSSDGRHRTAGKQAALNRLESREVRSYEAQHVNALWHCDFHHGSLRIVDEMGNWHTPKAFAVLDDCSRLVCHVQWYLEETASALIHALFQAFVKRGLPRSLMSDNGSAMVAGETKNGLFRLGVQHSLTLAYSPYQNGKQESFWGNLEGRLMAMMEGVEPLTLSFLNQATQAWVEMEYNKKWHVELACSPIERFLQGPDISRPAPESQQMRLAFSLQQERTQRQSDGTISIQGIRFEIPSHLRPLRQLSVRFQSWDLSEAYIVDQRTEKLLARIYPMDKAKNADARRRVLRTTKEKNPLQKKEDKEDLPVLMQRILADYAATGLPPAYLPKEKRKGDKDE